MLLILISPQQAKGGACMGQGGVYLRSVWREGCKSSVRMHCILERK